MAGTNSVLSQNLHSWNMCDTYSSCAILFKFSFICCICLPDKLLEKPPNAKIVAVLLKSNTANFEKFSKRTNY